MSQSSLVTNMLKFCCKGHIPLLGLKFHGMLKTVGRGYYLLL